MTEVANIEAADAPELMGVLAHALLFRLGGSQTFTADEFTDIQQSVTGIRMFVDEEARTLTVALKPVMTSEGPG
jgi:hypothetical protein